MFDHLGRAHWDSDCTIVIAIVHWHVPKIINHKLPVVVKLLALKFSRMPPLPLRSVRDVTYVHAVEVSENTSRELELDLLSVSLDVYAAFPEGRHGDALQLELFRGPGCRIQEVVTEAEVQSLYNPGVRLTLGTSQRNIIKLHWYLGKAHRDSDYTIVITVVHWQKVFNGRSQTHSGCEVTSVRVLPHAAIACTWRHVRARRVDIGKRPTRELELESSRTTSRYTFAYT